MWTNGTQISGNSGKSERKEIPRRVLPFFWKYSTGMNSPRNYRKLNSNGKRSWTQKNYFQIQDRRSQLENRNKKIDTIPKTPESVRVCDHCTLNFIFHCKLYNDLIKEISILEIISERNKLFRKFDYCGKLLFLFNNTDPYICRLNAVFVFEPWNISLVAICYDYISHTTLRSGNTGIKLLLLYFTCFKLWFSSHGI